MSDQEVNDADEAGASPEDDPAEQSVVGEVEANSGITADASVLSDEELAALQATGREDDPDDDGIDSGECNLYDFRDPSRVLNGRLPGLDSVYEAFCNAMQQVLKGMLGRTVEVSHAETTLTRLGDYQKSLPLPTSAHGANVEDRKHSMYLTADGRFVYGCVDAFFGGMNHSLPESLEREFSTSERRFMDLFVRETFRELQAAWAPICGLVFAPPRTMKVGSLGSGRDDQIMVVSRFTTGLNPGQVDFHLSMPYPLLDSLRPHLTAGPRGAEMSRNWQRRFRDRLTSVDIEARSVFTGVRITFGELVSLAPGDFIPVSAQNRVTLMVDEHPLYIGEPGVSNGMSAAKIVSRTDPR